MTAEQNNKTWTIYRKGWEEALKYLRFNLLKSKKSRYSEEDIEKALLESADVQNQTINLDNKNFTEEQLKAAYEAGLKENDKNMGFIIRTMYDGIYKKAFDDGKKTGISDGKKIESENTQKIIEKYEIQISKFNKILVEEREKANKEGWSKGFKDAQVGINSEKKEAHQQGYIKGRELCITNKELIEASNESYSSGFAACRRAQRSYILLITRRFFISIALGYIAYEWKVKPYLQEKDRLSHGETPDQAETRRKIISKCEDINGMVFKKLKKELRQEWYGVHAKCQDALDFHEAMREKVRKGNNQFFGQRNKAGYQDLSNGSGVIASPGILPELESFIKKV